MPLYPVGGNLFMQRPEEQERNSTPLWYGDMVPKRIFLNTSIVFIRASNSSWMWKHEGKIAFWDGFLTNKENIRTLVKNIAEEERRNVNV